MLPDSVTCIGANAFNGCRSLANIVIPESVTSIGEEAFSGCRSLTRITIPHSMSRIDRGTFDGCDSLICLTIPDSVTEIDKQVIAHFSPDLQVVGDFALSKESKWKMAVSLAYLHDPTALAFCEEGIIQYIKRKKRELFPEIFRNDLDKAIIRFLQKRIITKKNIDDEFLRPAIEASATKCAAILLEWKSKNVPLEEEELRFERELNKDLYDVTDMRKLWTYKKREDETLCITGYKSEEKKVDVPLRIGKNAVTVIGKEAFSTVKRGRSAYQRQILNQIIDIHLPESVTSVGESAFFGCSSLTSITIPKSVRSIGKGVFSGCSSLTSIEIPESVVKIGQCAF